ncbi:hypothetical protein BDV40DRAFT_282341 [Aspergillus tamarii]|uniref:Uncharacterized protein n=1 Tax=Aspergillus tamarii TaxID=41984 RepID=A0A5N6UBR9_ASPTM|nr:hypothetical protein BDV40DRAFT_282341 [Aspergillus tamarii]
MILERLWVGLMLHHVRQLRRTLRDLAELEPTVVCGIHVTLISSALNCLLGLRGTCRAQIHNQHVWPDIGGNSESSATQGTWSAACQIA